MRQHLDEIYVERRAERVGNQGDTGQSGNE
jgi:hypothetical protein